MKRALISAVIVIFLSPIYAATGSAQGPVSMGIEEEKVSFDLGADVGSLSGYTRYNIKFPINETSNGLLVLEGESELEFPIDSYIGGLTASLGKRGHWSLGLSIFKNMTEDTGKTTDIDLLTVQDQKTGEIERGWIIYSESDTDMDAFLMDLTGKFYIIKRAKTSLGLVAGYRYQSFSFEVSNVAQEDAWGGYIFVPGKAATYDITYSVPCGGIAFDIRPSGRFSMNLSAAYGWAFAEDEDDHILRSKRSTSKADGPFYSLKAEGRLSLSSRLYLLTAFEYLKIDTDGTQNQTWYATTSEAPAGTTYSGIDYRAVSEQLYLWVGMRYTF
jgi:outer membrane protease